MKIMPGYVYGQVLHTETHVSSVDLFDVSYDAEKTEVKTAIAEATQSIWQKIQPVDDPFVDELPYARRQVVLFVIHYPIYHPFVKENPPLLGVVQVVLSNEVIRAQIKKNARQLIITTVIFWFLGGFGSLLLTRLIVRPIRVLVDGAKIIGK